MDTTKVGPLDSQTAGLSAKDIADAFAVQRLELKRLTDASVGESGAWARSLELQETAVAYAFTRARWSLEATLADSKRARIARARLDLPRGITWQSVLDGASDLPMLGLRRSRVARYADWLESGDPAADWGIVLLFAHTEERRFEALVRILARAKARPVYPWRWDAYRRAFEAATQDLGEVPDILALARAWEAVGDVASAYSPHEVILDERPALRRLRTALDRLVASDLRGPGWRRHAPREATLSEDLMALSDDLERDVLRRATFEALMGVVSLTAGEREVLDMDLVGYETAEIALALDTTPGAIRRRRSDAVKKLKAADDSSSPSPLA